MIMSRIFSSAEPGPQLTWTAMVPAVILWRSPTNHFFVIDGAHRLSSLIAWVNNDYGIGVISHEFFGSDADPARKLAAQKTKQMVESAVGNYHAIAESFKLIAVQ